jgi:hypothetical protein
VEGLHLDLLVILLNKQQELTVNSKEPRHQQQKLQLERELERGGEGNG